MVAKLVLKKGDKKKCKNGRNGNGKVNPTGTKKRRRKKEQMFVKNYTTVAVKAGGSVSEICRVLKISRTTLWRYRKEHPELDEKLKELWEVKVDDLEQSTMDKAIHGWDEDIIYQGIKTGIRRVFSPVLMIFMLKTNRQEKYNIENHHQITASVPEIQEKIRKFLKDSAASMHLDISVKRDDVIENPVKPAGALESGK